MINKIICKAKYVETSISIYRSSIQKGASMCIQSIWYCTKSPIDNTTILSMSTAYGIWWD